MQFRKKIVEYCNQEARKLNGELELDESYSGGKKKGKRGREAESEPPHPKGLPAGKSAFGGVGHLTAL